MHEVFRARALARDAVWRVRDVSLVGPCAQLFRVHAVFPPSCVLAAALQGVVLASIVLCRPLASNAEPCGGFGIPCAQLFDDRRGVFEHRHRLVRFGPCGSEWFWACPLYTWMGTRCVLRVHWPDAAAVRVLFAVDFYNGQSWATIGGGFGNTANGSCVLTACM
jgi:hypothetical protein